MLVIHKDISVFGLDRQGNPASRPLDHESRRTRRLEASFWHRDRRHPVHVVEVRDPAVPGGFACLVEDQAALCASAIFELLRAYQTVFDAVSLVMDSVEGNSVSSELFVCGPRGNQLQGSPAYGWRGCWLNAMTLREPDRPW